METEKNGQGKPPIAPFVILLRLYVGATFIVLGARKLGDPVAFLKAIREYQLVDDTSYVLLNSIAAALPTVEILLGVALILGFARRGIALVFAVMLAAFSLAIYQRGVALSVSEAKDLCAIAFDCGCGTGVEKVCAKLAQNVGLFLASTYLVFAGPSRFALRERWFSS